MNCTSVDTNETNISRATVHRPRGKRLFFDFRWISSNCGTHANSLRLSKIWGCTSYRKHLLAKTVRVRDQSTDLSKISIELLTFRGPLKWVPIVSFSIFHISENKDIKNFQQMNISLSNLLNYGKNVADIHMIYDGICWEKFKKLIIKRLKWIMTVKLDNICVVEPWVKMSRFTEMQFLVIWTP